MALSSNVTHRRSSRTLRLINANGEPIKDTAITVTQKNHKFLFGCGAFDTIPLANKEGSKEVLAKLDDKMEKWLDLFNFATLPFYWGGFESEFGKPNTDKLMKAALWLKQRQVEIKGHPLCWHTATAPFLLSMTNDEILKTQLARIKRDVADFKGIINMWDVINEVVIMPIFDKYDNGITRICQQYGRIGLIRKVFEEAFETNPSATLLLNDFNTSISYEILIDGCLEAGIPISAIGIQSHQHQGYWGLEKLEQVLDRFSHFNIPIHFTENTLTSGYIMPPEIDDLNDFKPGSWPSTPEFEERQAKEVTEMYTALFAHPRVEAITNWTFGDEGSWLGAPAGFIRADNSLKPSYIELQKLIKKDWWTNTTAKTDDNGYVTIEGFKGDYELSLSPQNSNITTSNKLNIKLDDTMDTETIQF